MTEILRPEDENAFWRCGVVDIDVLPELGPSVRAKFDELWLAVQGADRE